MSYKIIGEALKKVLETKDSKVLYHQTSSQNKESILKNGFTLGNHSAINGDEILPTGFFFKETDKDIGLSGTEQIPVKLSYNNPLYVENREEFKDFLIKNSNEFKEYITKFDQFNNNNNEKSEEFVNRIIDAQNIENEDEKKQALDNIKKDKEEFFEEWKTWTNDTAADLRDISNKVFSNTNYDALIVNEDKGSWGRSVKSYIVFDPKQIEVVENNNEELTEAIDTPGFDIEHFKSLTSFNARIKYCNEKLKRLGSGSSRIVYRIDDDRVLKLARNKKGLAQNETEIDHSGHSYLDGLVAKVFEYDEKDLWVEMEFCKKLTPKRFKEITELNFKEFGNALEYSYGRNNPGKYQGATKPDDEIWENEFMYSMVDYMNGYGIPPGDFTRISSFGEDSEGDVVVVDYGLTDDVATTYYSR